jgi:hypothetical protein
VRRANGFSHEPILFELDRESKKQEGTSYKSTKTQSNLHPCAFAPFAADDAKSKTGRHILPVEHEISRGDRN